MGGLHPPMVAGVACVAHARSLSVTRQVAWYRRALSLTRELHVARAARQRYGLPAAAFNAHGRVVNLDAAAAAAWAARINAGRRATTAPPLTTGELLAAAALHEAAHELIMQYGVSPNGTPVLEEAVAAWRADGALPSADTFAQDFAGAYAKASEAANANEPAIAESIAGAELLEETWLMGSALTNLAFAPLHELFKHELAAGEGWATASRLAEHGLAMVQLAPVRSASDLDPNQAGAGQLNENSLLWLLTLPVRLEPTSLAGQMRVAVTAWGPYLMGGGAFLTELLRAADWLREEGKGGAAAPGPHGPPPVSDFMPSGHGAGRENFTPDRAWMPEVAMVAKSVYVWLAQLEGRYGHQVRQLDQVPDAALSELREDGFNAVWLIGVWERSHASRALKRARGQPDAGASAYALHDYEIAADLGGQAAFEELKRRAWAHGLRLASDMVPNHTGLDSRWMVEHPDWFVQLPQPPFEGYSFTGPNLAIDPAIEVRVEDGYYDGTDAAVVFERRDPGTGAKRYVYHGNDGTAMPWNDTAQLDYLRQDVREAVTATVVAVARRFPIIRFDAAMTLAKRHVQRLWHPLPGEGGAIPSRARFGVSAEEFERLMPHEFWRDLVVSMAERAPDTLLLAEAFWLMEGFFVRELGMHRVYNSAFMHMLMHEQNVAYRRLLKTLLAFDPRVLQRYVNFMSNPDEESAREQFGAGDKYFGVATLLATLPGMPMFGHGQVEGLVEKYGMEYLAPKLAESPDAGLIARHRRELAPLLNARGAFAGASAFRLFDLVGDDGVEEAAYVYVNRPAPAGGALSSLVAFNNSPGRVVGGVRMSVPFADPLRGGGLRSEPLHEALGLRAGGGPLVRLTPFVRGGPEVVVELTTLEQRGLRLELGPYEAQVLLVTQVEELAAPVAVQAPAPARRARVRRAYDARLAGDRGVAKRRAAKRTRR